MSHQLLLLLTIKLLSVPIVILVVVVQNLVAGAGDLKKLWVSASPMLVSPVDLPVDREDLDRLVVLRDLVDRAKSLALVPLEAHLEDLVVLAHVVAWGAWAVVVWGEAWAWAAWVALPLISVSSI
jgi:hypothetical protein